MSALALMTRAGRTPKRAVEETRGVDDGTGGEVDCLFLKPGKR
jgi:hypothetical protein